MEAAERKEREKMADIRRERDSGLLGADEATIAVIAVAPPGDFFKDFFKDVFQRFLSKICSKIFSKIFSKFFFTTFLKDFLHNFDHFHHVPGDSQPPGRRGRLEMEAAERKARENMTDIRR